MISGAAVLVVFEAVLVAFAYWETAWQGSHRRLWEGVVVLHARLVYKLARRSVAGLHHGAYGAALLLDHLDVVGWIAKRTQRSTSDLAEIDFGGAAGRLVMTLAGAAMGAGGGVWATGSLSVPVTALGGALGCLLHGAGEWSAGQTEGFASPAEIRKSFSTRAMRRSARRTRPSLAETHRVPASEVGLRIARRGYYWLHASWQDFVLMIAPPQTGKTGLMGSMVIDAPGGAVVTSTKADIIEHTLALRSDGGRPTWIFNPEGLGAFPSTLRWSPITGCEEPAVAMMRAGYLVSGVPQKANLANEDFWEGMAARVLRALLFAAAVSGADMCELRRWACDPDDQRARRILTEHPGTPGGWIESLEQIRLAPEKTRGSIFLTLSRCFEFMDDPALAEAVLPRDADSSFDVGALINERATLYLIGSERPYGPLGPLFSAFVGHVFEEAKAQAGATQAGRLCPPLLLGLDEAALICPVPLPRWVSDAAGRGIAVVAAVQSRSQLEERWEREGAATIWNNANVKVIYGGNTVVDDLEDIAKLCDEIHRVRHTRTTSTHGERSRSSAPQREPVMAAGKIRMLPERHVLVLRRSARPVIGKVLYVWDRPDVCAAKAPAVARAPARWHVPVAARLAVRRPQPEPVGATVVPIRRGVLVSKDAGAASVGES